MYMVFLDRQNSEKAYKMCKRVKTAPGIRISAARRWKIPTPVLKCNNENKQISFLGLHFCDIMPCF